MKLILALIIALGAIAVYAQAPDIQWQNTIGGGENDYLHTMQQCSDGGYILGGYSKSNISPDKTENCIGSNDYWVVKLDSLGEIDWQNTIGGSGPDYLNSIQQTFDNGFILGGQSSSGISGDKTEPLLGGGYSDYWVVKIDSIGNIQWQNTIGGDNYDYLYTIKQTSDSGYVLGGYSSSNISFDKTENCMGDKDFWVVKLNTIGNIEWQNTIGGNGEDEFHALQQTIDGGYVVAGWSSSGISGDKTDSCRGERDFWVVKLDETGQLIWQRTVGGSGDDYLHTVIQIKDGGYILGGYSESGISGDKTDYCRGFFDYWLVKLDVSGNIVWQRTIGGDSPDQLFSIYQTSDYGLILGGHSQSDISGEKTENSMGNGDYWIVKLNSSGNILWQSTIGGFSNYDLCYTANQTFDGGYILGGESNSNISGDKTENSMGGIDYWVIKLYPDTGIVVSTDQVENDKNVLAYPNPCSVKLIIEAESFNHVDIVNISGQVVKSMDIFENRTLINIADLSEGVYILKLTSNKEIFIKKFIKD